MVPKILGLDYGQKRIGVALADSVLNIAVLRETLRPKSQAEAIQTLRALITKEHVTKIVVGLPLTFEGKDSSQTRATRTFAKMLEEQTGVSVVFQDERLTSVEAKKHLALLRRKERDIDGASARIILQTYLDKTCHPERGAHSLRSA